jgi:hypothetical protein
MIADSFFNNFKFYLGAQAAKFRKLPGVRDMLRYWAAPDPKAVPGFAGDQSYK